MNQISLTHANLGREILVTREMVFAIYYSEAHKATHVLSSGGAIIPVSESVNVVRERVYGNKQSSAVTGAPLPSFPPSVL